MEKDPRLHCNRGFSLIKNRILGCGLVFIIFSSFEVFNKPLVSPFQFFPETIRSLVGFVMFPQLVVVLRFATICVNKTSSVESSFCFPDLDCHSPTKVSFRFCHGHLHSHLTSMVIKRQCFHVIICL